MKKKEKIAVIVVTYNRKELLRRCINAILKQTYKVDKIIVIDNASTDGTEEMMTKTYYRNKKIDYVRLDKNIGGAGGFHYGMKKAYKEGYDWIWVMDDDTIVTKNALKELINAKNILLKKRIKFGFLNSIVYWKDNNLCLFNLPTAKNDINTYQFLSHGMIKINRATFVSFLISKKIIKIVGLPLKEFFIWADDTEYTLRISLNYDLPGYYISKSKVYHLTKLNSFYSYEFINRENYKKYCYDIRNRVYIIKNIPQIKYKLDYLKVTLINLLRILFSKKIIYFPALIFSLIWGIFFNPKIEKVD